MPQPKLLSSIGRSTEELLWLLVPQLNTPSELIRWSQTLSKLNHGQIERLASGEFSTLGCIVVAEKLITAEEDKPTSKRDWESVVVAVMSLRDSARRAGYDVLEAASTRARLRIAGEFIDQLDFAIAEAENDLERLSRSKESVVLISGMIGRQLLARGDRRRALSFLERAVYPVVSSVSRDQMLAGLAASEASGDVDPEKAVNHALGAVNIAQNDRGITPEELTRALAEAATAVYLLRPGMEGASRAFPYWSQAAAAMLSCEEQTNEWKDLAVVFMHQTAYLWSQSHDNASPMRNGEVYAPPSRGTFVKLNPGRLAYFSSGKLEGLRALLVDYADAIGNDDSARQWCLSMLQESSFDVLSPVQATAAQAVIPHLAAARQYGASLEAAVAFSTTIVFHRWLNDGSQLFKNRSIREMGERLNRAEKHEVERFAFSFALVGSALKAAYDWATDQPDKLRSTTEIGAVCKQLATKAADPSLWLTASEMLAAVASGDATRMRLDSIASGYTGVSVDVLSATKFLLCSIHGSPSIAWNSQVVGLEWVIRNVYAAGSTGYRILILPFVVEYWTGVLRDNAMSLRNPSLVASGLSSALSEPPAKQVAAVLRSVRIGVDRRIDDRAMRWITEM